MKKILIFTGIFLFLTLNSSAHTPQEENIFTVHMDNGGFSPSMLTIPPNGTIIFENIDTIDRWPASNIHPTHGIYPEFDPKEPIPPGEEWQFKFEKTGSWKYHDHLNPKITGTVTVNSAEGTTKPSYKKSLVQKLFDMISELVGRFRNYLFKNKDRPASINLDGLSINEITSDPEKLAQYLKTAGINDAMAGLIEESGGGSSFDCHQQAHSIGQIGYELTGEEAFRDCSAFCHSGCYHGAMASFLNDAGTDNIAENIKRICQTFETNFGIFECLHGVGHGILAYTNYDLPEAIQECKKLGDSFGISSCYGGLFMENILTGQGLGASKSEHETSWLKKDDPYFPCNVIGNDSDLRYQCYQMQTSWMLTITGSDFKKIAEYCLQAPADMVSVCMKSYGRDAAGHTLRNQEKIIALCNNVPEKNNYRDNCLIGAVNVIVDFWGHELKDQAAGLCRLAAETNKNSCYTSLIFRLYGLFKGKNEKLEICRTMESPYKEQCFSAYERTAN